MERITIGWILILAHLAGAKDLPMRTANRNIFQVGISSVLHDLFQKFPVEGSLEEALIRNVSAPCIGHTLEWILQLRKVQDSRMPDVWAVQMFDAFGKFPEGILSGHINPLGDYDECVGIRATGVNFNQSIQDLYPDLPASFGGLYCSVQLTPVVSGGRDDGGSGKRRNFNEEGLSRESVSPTELLELMAITEGIYMIPSWATCLPSTCTVQDVGHLATNLLTALELDDLLRPFPPPSCTAGVNPDLDAADISVITLLGVLFTTCILAGGVDMWRNRGDGKRSKPGLALRYFLAFSAYTNIRKWANTRTSGDDLGCIHGIRVLSTSWVILAHTWYMILFMPSWNMVDVKTVYKDWTILTVLNSTFSVDTFFVMSGMLVSFNLLKLLEKNNGKFNLVMFYIHRYLRITPTYALLVGILATIFPYLGSGPFWSVLERLSVNCEDNWWTNLLYINNFVYTDRMCQGEAWYLANDMQFYILSPLFIYPLYRWKRIGLGLLLVTTIGSVLSPALIVYFMDYPQPVTIPMRSQPDYFNAIYIKPHTRIQTYLIGIALGYLLFTKRNKKVHIPKPVQLIGWIGAGGTALSVLYGIFPWFNPETEIEVLPATIYAGLGRFSWGCSVSWVIFTCVKGYGGLINQFLSWKVFMPLGRLSFCVFLVSLHLQMTLHLSLKQSITYDPYTMVNFFMAHLMMSFLVGFLCTLILESPFIIIEKLLFEGAAGKAPRVLRSAEVKPPAERYGIYYQNQEMSIDAQKMEKSEL